MSKILGVHKYSTLTSFTTTVLTSGSGTYVPPANALYLRIKIVGGGGGGGSYNLAGGTNATATTFGTLSAGGGQGGGTNNNTNYTLVVPGGTNTVTMANFTLIQSLPGQGGIPGWAPGNGQGVGGNGGSTPFGPGGVGGNSNGPAGIIPAPNTGAGGGSNPNQPTATGGATGGGAGGYIEGIISPVAASYAYTIGAKGTNPNSLSNGSDGVIFIEEHYV